MKIAITTPTGNIGSKLVAALLEAGGHEIVLLARKRERLGDAEAKGAKILVGSLEDAGYVEKALEGVDALFWVNPANYQVDDFRAYYRKLSVVGARAASVNKVKHVVLLSSSGAHLGERTGPVNGLYDAEQIFRKTSENLTILRPTFFMENFLMSLDTISQAQSIFLPVSGTRSLPMIATRDIIPDALRALVDESPKGVRIVPQLGPKDYSYDEAATIIGKEWGQQIKHVQTTPEQTREALQGMGMSLNAADTMIELYTAIDQGFLKAELPRDAESTTPTTLEAFAKEVIVPAMQLTN